MFLRQTRARLLHQAKEIAFRAGGFESMLDLNERRELEATMGFHGQWEEHRRFQRTFFEQQGLRPEHRFLEFGCGPLTAGLPLIEYLNVGNYTGVDVRTSVLDLAWKQVGKARMSGKNPRLLHSYTFGDEYLNGEKFDFISSFSVLFHLDDAQLDACFAAVARQLESTGRYFANVNVDAPGSSWLEFPFVQREVHAYRDAAARHKLTTTNLGPISGLGFRLTGIERSNPLLIFQRES